MQQPDITTQTDDGLMGALGALAHRMHLPTTLVKFLIVGGIGYVINQFCLFLVYDAPLLTFLPAKETATDLWLFTHPDVRLLIASVVAVESAILFQFRAHERWTFRNRIRRGWIGLRFLKFNVSAGVSPIISVGITNIMTVQLEMSPYIANTIGIVIASFWNWTLNTMVIWPRKEAS